MPLSETCATLTNLASGKVCFILDASESAEQYQAEIIALAQEVLSGLPATVERSLYFLGNPSAYPSQQLVNRAAQWFQENRRRASLITPVWTQWEQEEMSTIVIIGAGRIFDVDDWEETPLLRRTLLVNMGESLRGSTSVEEWTHPTAQDLCQRLNDPVIRIEITGPGFMPTWWDNKGYTLHLVNGESVLSADHLEDCTIQLRFLVLHDDEIRAAVTRASGARSAVSLNSIDTLPLVGINAGSLSEQERDLFQKARQRTAFACPHCSHLHPWHTLRCLEDAIIIGEPVYPTLQARRATGFVIFRDRVNEVQFAVHDGQVLCIGENAVAVQEGQTARLYRFDERGGWTRSDAVLEPYARIGERTYAILL